MQFTGRFLKSRLLPSFVRRSLSDGVVRSPYRDVSLSNLPYYDYVFENITYHKNRTSIVDGLTDQSLSFAEVADKAARFASGLKSMSDCTTLGIFLPNCVEYPLIFSGAAKANITSTTLNPAYTSREISKQLMLSKPI